MLRALFRQSSLVFNIRKMFSIEIKKNLSQISQTQGPGLNVAISGASKWNNEGRRLHYIYEIRKHISIVINYSDVLFAPKIPWNSELGRCGRIKRSLIRLNEMKNDTAKLIFTFSHSTLLQNCSCIVHAE